MADPTPARSFLFSLSLTVFLSFYHEFLRSFLSSSLLATSPESFSLLGEIPNDCLIHFRAIIHRPVALCDFRIQLGRSAFRCLFQAVVYRKPGKAEQSQRYVCLGGAVSDGRRRSSDETTATRGGYLRWSRPSTVTRNTIDADRRQSASVGVARPQPILDNGDKATRRSLSQNPTSNSP